MDFSDIWDELNIGGMIEAEAWKGRFGYFIMGKEVVRGHPDG